MDFLMNSGVRVSLAANIGLLAVLLFLPFQPFFSLKSSDGQEVKVWLRSSSLQMTFESSSAEFHLPFSELEARICPVTQSSAVNALCQHLWPLETTAVLCVIVGMMAGIAGLLAGLNAGYIVWKGRIFSKKTLIGYYLTGPLVLVMLLLYMLAASSVDWSEEGVSKRLEAGSFYLLLACLLGIASTCSYVWLRLTGNIEGIDTSEGLLPELDPSSTPQSQQITLLATQLEHYKTLAQEGEHVSQRHLILKDRYTDLQKDIEVRNR